MPGLSSPQTTRPFFGRAAAHRHALARGASGSTALDATVREGARHVGVGADDRHIHPLDGQGVALAAIQALAAELERLRAENASLAGRLGAIESGFHPR